MQARAAGILAVLTTVASCRAPTAVRAERIEARFAERGLPGCIAVVEPARGFSYTFNAERARTAYIPASTFKIFNSLVALETGAIGDVDETLPWDGTRHGIAAWNRNTNLRRGMRHSVVWFYQALARRIGRERMQHYLDRVGYGNKTMGGPIDRFWLDGALRITSHQQIDFLRRLHAGDLPFSKRTMDAVKRIMVREQGPDYTVRAKTGWGVRFEDKVGWYVGWVESQADRSGQPDSQTEPRLCLRDRRKARERARTSPARSADDGVSPETTRLGGATKPGFACGTGARAEGERQGAAAAGRSQRDSQTEPRPRVVFFALNLRVEHARDLGARIELAMDTLRILGVP